MHKTIDEAVCFVNELSQKIENTDCLVYLAVPYTAIRSCAKAAQKTSIVIGAQNMNDASEGAFTGEIAAKMLVDAGAKFVILGHSERRRLFHESNGFVRKKMKKALEAGLQPVVCVGESAEERDAGQEKTVVKKQIKESLAETGEEQMKSIILAYEPVWAIGTGRTATPETAQEMHSFCREAVSEIWPGETADQLVIQYGGSVKPDNTAELMEQPDIDGLLVGGASLDPETFGQIVKHSR